MTIILSVLNESTAIDDAHVQAMLPAFQEQWTADLAVVWPVEAASFRFVAKGQPVPKGSWWLVFLDDSDQAGALAYHDLTNEGLPLSKVFVKTLNADHSSISVAATHELCEMAVDPWLNGAFQDAHGTFWASEVCDPVEDGMYGYLLKGVEVSDFITPAWFGHKSSVGPLDFKAHAHVPFAVLAGGYAQYFSPHRGWVQVIGRDGLLKTHVMSPAEGSRRERRARGKLAWKWSARA